MTEADGLALDREVQPGLARPVPGTLVVGDEARASRLIGGGLDPGPERLDLAERRLETLAGAAERGGLFLGDRAIEAAQALARAAQRRRPRARAVASA
ncbi:MAG: hypothetical protein HY727_08125 [Candidatus Rokubacteria bacterium]|nr:hypothetical protein [Candidatus Rokubacteria bacterium]